MGAIDALLPVCAMIFAGGVLRHFRFIPGAFYATSDRLVYFLFFPAMLFWKIGKAENLSHVTGNLQLAVLLCVGVIFLLSLILIRVIPVTPFNAGAFSQSCYRFNTYIGIGVVMGAVGSTGVAIFGVLVGSIIPLINVLAVFTLTIYADMKLDRYQRIGMLFRAILSNPLILACVAGMGVSYFNLTFPHVVDNLLSLLSSPALPLALLSIGHSLSFSGLESHWRTSLLAASIKLVLFPFATFCLFRWWDICGTAFKVGMVFSALPTSTAIQILCSQHKGNAELASTAIAVSTVLSILPLSIVLVWLKGGA